MMNIFRLLGDFSHVVSFFVLLLRLYAGRTATGISLKSQELFLLVFVTRYLDLFMTHSLYNIVMKIVYISVSSAIVYMMRFVNPWKSSYDSSKDTFLHVKFAIAPCAVLALLINYEFTILEIFWTFSIYLEALAILPQLILLQRHGEVENLTSHYVATLGLYRFFYLLNWIYRAWTEVSYSTLWIPWIAGVVQTAIYIDFFYYYVTSKAQGKKMALPK